MKIAQNILWSGIFILLTLSCNLNQQKSYKTIGSIERLSPALDSIIKPGAVIELLAEGFQWAEGPVWINSGNFLLFSDIPSNSIYKWSQKDSIQLYLKPSGYTGSEPRGGETGSNGLLINPQGMLVMCQHGNRQMAMMDAPLKKPLPKFITLADSYMGARLNSPNDAVYSSTGDLYFTDPPYGLEKQAEDPAKKLSFQGVYRLNKDGNLDLLISNLSRPNGIGLSPDEKILYVANSDSARAVWMAYRLTEKGMLGIGSVFHDVTREAKHEAGLPDGLKVSKKGVLFATGPGGVWIFSNGGKALGIIRTTVPTANCAFNSDESVLYITANHYLLRVKLK
jgi:gluconolactonase